MPTPVITGKMSTKVIVLVAHTFATQQTMKQAWSDWIRPEFVFIRHPFPACKKETAHSNNFQLYFFFFIKDAHKMAL
jgi:hypothetical protein